MGHPRHVLQLNIQVRSRRLARQHTAMHMTTPPVLSLAKEPIMPSLSVLLVHYLLLLHPSTWPFVGLRHLRGLYGLPTAALLNFAPDSEAINACVTFSDSL